MFWKLASLSASSPVELVLDKDNFTLEELLDEEEIIQECKALNSRLINFLRDRAQVEQLLQYIINEPPEDAESTRIFKFPFIACEIFTCEIDVILKTLVEEEELMDLLFSFLDPTRSHTALLAGYFSKVVICLMMRKTMSLMNYVQSHQHVFEQLVDLIGITSIMEVLIRLVGGDDHMFPNSLDVMANSNLLEMIVDKLSPLSSPEVHANAAETLCAITRNLMSPLNTKLSSSSFVARIFGHALEDSNSKSALVHSLSVCISMLDPRRSFPSPFIHSFRSHVYEAPVLLNPETVGAMLPKLGDLLMLLNVSSDEKVLPTTYGELRPPLGKYRLKIVEFIAVLLKIGNEVAEKDLVSSGTIQRVLDLFFEYPYNNALHHHVESIIFSCLESKNITIVDHIFQECGLVPRILQTSRSPTVSGELNQPTIAAAGKCGPRLGNLGHITRISNKIVQLGKTDIRIQAHLQENSEWDDWQVTLQERNLVENVYHWACGRPTALHDRTRDSDDDDIQDRDYDVAALANNLSQAFRYSIYDNNDSEEGQRVLDHDEEDGYFDDESAEIVMSSLRLGDDQGSSLFTNSNWFAFQDDRTGAAHDRQSAVMDDINLSGASNGGNSNSSSDDEVVVGEEELAESQNPANGICSSTTTTTQNGFGGSTSITTGDLDSQNEKPSASGGTHFGFETSASDDLFGDGPIPKSVGWGHSNGFADGRSILNPLEDYSNSGLDLANAAEKVSAPVSSMSSGGILPNGTSESTSSSETSAESNSSQRTAVAAYSLFEEDVEFVGVELEGTEKAMEQALKEGIVGEAGPLKRNIIPKIVAEENSDDSGTKMKEFNDANYWRVDQEVAVLE